jgi:hypothetical protein
MTFAYKIILCTLRRFKSIKEPIAAAIAGFISAWALALDIKERRIFLATVVFCRSIVNLKLS